MWWLDRGLYTESDAAPGPACFREWFDQYVQSLNVEAVEYGYDPAGSPEARNRVMDEHADRGCWYLVVFVIGCVAVAVMVLFVVWMAARW